MIRVQLVKCEMLIDSFSMQSGELKEKLKTIVNNQGKEE